MNTPDPVAARPLDARLARRLIEPLRHTRVRPNHLTTVRLLLGLVAAVCLGQGSLFWANIGAFVFALSNFVDHTDGELARITGATSRFGHWYDLASDALIHVLLFAALGFGLRDSGWGAAASIMGLVAGVAVAYIFWLHMQMVEKHGKTEARMPAAAFFEIEDILYLFPLVTLFAVRAPFLIAAVIGAPCFALWLSWYFRRTL